MTIADNALRKNQAFIQSFTFEDKSKEGAETSAKIEAFLWKYPGTKNIINVENDRKYQKKDIDLIWIYQFQGKEITKYIEVKSDTHDQKNLAFETLSNKEKGTPGCFMYTEADYIFYYFEKTKNTYALEMKKVRPWFIENMHKFHEVYSKTPSRYRKGKYTSVSRLVPVKTLLKKFPNTKIFNIDKFKFNHQNISIFENLLIETKKQLNLNIDNLPQANRFEKLQDVFNFIRCRNRISNKDIREHFKWSSREANYYLQALEQLNLIFYEKHEDTFIYEINREMRKNISDKDLDLILCKSALKNPICYWIIDKYHTSKQIPQPDDILLYIHTDFENINLSESTLKRRINCLLNWSNWIINKLENAK